MEGSNKPLTTQIIYRFIPIILFSSSKCHSLVVFTKNIHNICLVGNLNKMPKHLGFKLRNAL
ncbi:hypothetical protein Hanom_Chr01g00088181 [Helianthus anomalus]